jgi:hypothetical protein
LSLLLHGVRGDAGWSGDIAVVSAGVKRLLQ